jgi:hypothetical protein
VDGGGRVLQIGNLTFVSVTLNTFEVPTPPGAKLLEK